MNGHGVEEVGWKKLYIFGIGGAGNAILSTILQYVEKIKRNREEEAKIWDEGIRGWAILNTAITDGQRTWIAKRKRWTGPMIIDKTMIGRGKHDYTGVGMDWEYARELMKYDTTIPENASLPRIFEMANKTEIEEAQAVLIIHGVGKGTGCGASPVLAEFLKTEFPKLSRRETGKNIFTLTVLPFSFEIEGGEDYAENAIIGFTEIVKSSDVVIVVSNRTLEERFGEDIEAINRFLIKVIELMIAPTIKDFKSVVPHDLNDIVRRLKKHSQELAGKQVGVIVPFIGETSIGDPFGLVINTFKGDEGKFVDCDLTTASGAIFILVGNPSLVGKIKKAKNNNGENIFMKTARDEIFKNPDIFIDVWDVQSPAFEELYFLALIFNPKIEDLNKMWEKVSNKDIKAKAESILNCLGTGGV